MGVGVHRADLPPAPRGGRAGGPLPRPRTGRERSCSATPGGTGSRAPSGPRGRGCAANRCPPTRPRATSRRRRRSSTTRRTSPPTTSSRSSPSTPRSSAPPPSRTASPCWPPPSPPGRWRPRRWGTTGCPGRAEEHDRLLTELLGPRPTGGLRPRRLQELADRISAAFGPRTHVNPDSPAQILKAFASAGLPIPSTRAHVLKRVDHPAVPLLLEYKELARLHAAHGWAWLDTWVRGGRFRPEYVAGGVVSGRWATSGGGALQIPRVLRRAVVADPGWSWSSRTPPSSSPGCWRPSRATGRSPRPPPTATSTRPCRRVRRRSSGARGSVSRAAASRGTRPSSRCCPPCTGGRRGGRTAPRRPAEPVPRGVRLRGGRRAGGGGGRLVRSRLGRTCPPPPPGWRELTSAGDDASAERRGAAAQALRSRGRFTRNFVVQATAADWALALLASLRRRLVPWTARGWSSSSTTR